MLRVLRNHAQSPLIQAVVVVIAVVFVFWGVGTNLGTRGNAVATVDDHTIDGPSYGRAYDRLLESYRQQFGGQIPENMLNSSAIRQQAVGQLVQQALIAKGAGELGIIVGDPEVRRAIAAMPAFQNNGVFDPATYKAVLAQNRFSENGFEEGLRGDLQRDRAVAAVTGFAVTPEGELDQWMSFLDRELRLDYALFARADYEKRAPTDEAALAAWYEEKKEQYRPAPQYKFSYLAFPFAADVAEAQVGEDEMRAYYGEQSPGWRTPERRHLRHILFRAGEDAPAELKTAKKQEAEQALANIRGGADFLKLADELTEDPSGKGKGGDLGMVTRGQTVPQFEAEAFALDAGAVSDVVESPFGFHIIKVESVQPEATPSFEEKRAEIERILAMQKARTITFKKASAAYEDVIRMGSLAKYAEAGHELTGTDYIKQNAVPEDRAELRDPAVARAAFALGKGELSSIVEGAFGYAIVFADDVKTMELPALDEVRERAVADFRREKGAELVRKAAEDTLAALEKDGKWPEGVEVRRSAFLKRGGADADVAMPVAQDAFARLGKSRLPEAPVGLGDDFVVYRISGVRQGGDALSPALRDALRAQLTQGRQDRLLTQWLAGIRRNSKIWINPEIFK